MAALRAHAARSRRGSRSRTAEGVLTFVHPALLLCLLLPAAWLVAFRPGSSRRGLLVLKAVSFAFVVLALAQPVFRYDRTRVAVAVLVDTSASLTRADLDSATARIRSLEKSRGGNSLTVIPFARDSRSLGPGELAAGGSLQYSAGESGLGTNLEAAIGDGIAALPGDSIRRIALITDGNENLGSVSRAAWQARDLGIAIDAFPLAGRPRPAFSIDSVSAPQQVYSGERFPVEFSITSPRAGDATLQLEADGRPLGTQAIHIVPGVNRVAVQAAVKTAGVVALSSVLDAAALGSARYEYALSVRRPRVLLVSEDPPEADAHLLQVLDTNQFEVQRAAAGIPPDLAPYQLVIFNNRDMQSITQPDQRRLDAFEKQGGGILWIAGEKNVYAGKPEDPETPLALALPAKLAPPRSPEGTCVILIIDKSSSMEGKKMDLARLASIGVVENLRPQDYVAVLIFDNSFEWAVPLRKAGDKALIKRLISGITPDGGTQIAPALSEAFHKIVPVEAVYKHIVLLTDGISEEGDSLALAREAAGSRVTISTVGLGQDVNRSYLEKIAANSNGKSYFLIEPTGLEQILLKDVQEHTGTTAVEKPLKPHVEQQAALFEGIDLASAPALQGYVRFEARPGSSELLSLDRDPLLVRWQYGLGRSAVFTSDAKNRWASSWLSWKGFDPFWSNVLRDLLPHAPPSEARAAYDAASGDLVVDYHLAAGMAAPASIPDIFALGPGGFRRAAQISRVLDGHYRARVHVGEMEGLVRVRPLLESRAFPEVGFYRPEAEMASFGTNTALLQELASLTGGIFEPTPAQVFAPRGHSVPATLRLWPGMLAIAVVLNFIELLARKWKGVRPWFPQRAVSPA